MSLLFLLACFQSWTVTEPEDDCQARIVYQDADRDGYGGAQRFSGCSQDIPFADFADSNTDCDDADAQVYPGAQELCDGRDQDCDGEVDNDPVDAATWYSDLDGDGYGDEASAQTLCEQPSGAVAQGGDCQDSDATQYPGAPEICGDGLPNDCLEGAPEECRLLGSLLLSGAQDTAQGVTGLGWVLASAELNGDTLPDLAMGSDSGEAVLVVGQGKPIDSLLYSTALNAGFGAALTTGDMNGDGTPDLVVGAPGAGVSYLFSGPLPADDTPDSSASGTLRHDKVNAQDMVLHAPGDLDDDFAPELLLGFPTPGKSTDPGRVELHSGFWSGTYQGQVAQVTGHASDRLGQSIAHADLDGDGVPQAVLCSRYALYVLDPLSSGDLLVEDAATAELEAGEPALLELSFAGDVLGDGHEGVWVSNTATNQVGYLDGQAKTFKTLALRLEVAAEMSGQISGGQDVDSDGNADLLVGYTGQRSSQVSLSYGPFEAGVAEPDLLFEDLSPLSSDLLLTADMNGDGAGEVALGQPSESRVYLFFGSSI